MSTQDIDTRMALLEAAGELFAESGFAKVTTRMIADRAGVNLSGIHYHFGNKEKLYVEAFRYVCQRGEKRTLSDVLEENPDLLKTRKGLAQAIVITCRDFFGEIFSPDKPEWWLRLVVREMSNPSSALPVLVREVFAPHHEEDVACYRRIKPDATEEEAVIWRCMLISQGVFHMLSRSAFAMMRGKEMDAEFIETLIRMTARSMISLAGLPMPDELRD